MIEKKMVNIVNIRVINEMYEKIMTCVRRHGEATHKFPITIKFHLWSTFNPYLSILILDVFMEYI